MATVQPFELRVQHIFSASDRNADSGLDEVSILPERCTLGGINSRSMGRTGEICRHSDANQTLNTVLWPRVRSPGSFDPAIQTLP